jgi:transposase
VHRARANALCRLIDAYGFEIDSTASQLAGRLARNDGHHTIQALPGVGPTLAAVFVAEIAAVERFPSPGTCARGPG